MSGCPLCGCPDVDFDPYGGAAVCGNPACGHVLNEQRIVTDISFCETAGGGKAVVGQRVPWESGRYRQSREQSILRGNMRIEWIARRLKCTEDTMCEAKRIFALAVQWQFTRSRRTLYVGAVCLYIATRLNGSPVLLIDFADVLRCYLRTLGRVYLKLVRMLHFDGSNLIQTIDPSLYLDRFAKKLDLGEAHFPVVQTASRMIASMTRDMIAYGRRPAGVCGAALLVAAACHHQRISAHKVAQVVRMSESTILLRLQEIKRTAVADLSLDAFGQMDQQKICRRSLELPPCILLSSRKRLLKLKAKARGQLRDEDVMKAVLQADQDRYTKPEHLVQETVKDLRDSLFGDDSPLVSTQETQASGDLEDSLEVEVREDKDSGNESSCDGKDPLEREAQDLDVDVEDFFGAFTFAKPLSYLGVTGEAVDLSAYTIEADSEFGRMLLDDEEANAKALLWHQIQKEALPDLMIREEKMAIRVKGREPTKKKRQPGKTNLAADTPAKAASQLAETLSKSDAKRFCQNFESLFDV